MKKNKLKLHTEKSSLTCEVLNRIEKDAVKPYSGVRFLCINCIVWFAWVLSIVFGAMSVAVLVYVTNHARFALYEATHATPILFFIDVIPYIWIIAFISMIMFAFYNMRHTKRGYKYPFLKLLASSLILSVGSGAVLSFFGVGYLIDTQLAHTMPAYQSLEYSEKQMWQNPTEGRLLGTFTSMDDKDELYMFMDSNKELWSIQTEELRDVDRKLLGSGTVVRVLGTTTSKVSNQFHACGVFPWMFDKNVSMKDMKKDRKIFIERMYGYMEKGERLRSFEHEVFKEDQDMPFEEMSICADLSIVKRMKFKE